MVFSNTQLLDVPSFFVKVRFWANLMHKVVAIETVPCLNFVFFLEGGQTTQPQKKSCLFRCKNRPTRLYPKGVPHEGPSSVRFRSKLEFSICWSFSAHPVLRRDTQPSIMLNFWVCVSCVRLSVVVCTGFFHFFVKKTIRIEING